MCLRWGSNERRIHPGGDRRGLYRDRHSDDRDCLDDEGHFTQPGATGNEAQPLLTVPGLRADLALGALQYEVFKTEYEQEYILLNREAKE